MKALLEHNIEDMNDYLSEIACTSMNYFDIGNEKEARTPENFYHGLILGLIVTLRDRYRIVSNRESGRGRYDIAMYPLEKNQDAFLMEFKVWDKKKEKKSGRDSRKCVPADRRKEICDRSCHSQESTKNVFISLVLHLQEKKYL